MKTKRHLTRQEEFEILKLILDKFLWIGVFLITYAIYRIINYTNEFTTNMLVLLSGAIILLIFVYILVSEFHFVMNNK